MTAKVDSLISDIGEMNADIEDLCEGKSEEYRARFSELMEKPEERDPDLWEIAGADISLPVSAYFDVAPDSRDDYWRGSMASMMAAARTQALYETGILDALIDMSERNGDKINKQSRKLTRSELKLAVEKLPGSGVTDAAKAKRKIR